MREARQVKPSLKLQVAHPPDWLPEAHTSADLGETISYNTELVILLSGLRALRESFSRPRAWNTAFSSSWRLKDGTDANLIQGRFGYHFPHPGQEEDILTETNVKNGLHLPTPVAVRVFLFLFFFFVSDGALSG